VDGVVERLCVVVYTAWVILRGCGLIVYGGLWNVGFYSDKFAVYLTACFESRFTDYVDGTFS
jgi:hypothetical protein